MEKVNRFEKINITKFAELTIDLSYLIDVKEKEDRESLSRLVLGLLESCIVITEYELDGVKFKDIKEYELAYLKKLMKENPDWFKKEAIEKYS